MLGMLLRISTPFHVRTLNDLINLLQLRLGEHDVTCCTVLKCPLSMPGKMQPRMNVKKTWGKDLDVRRSRKRYDMGPKGAYPGDTKLCGGDVLLLGKRCQRVHDGKVVPQVLL